MRRFASALCALTACAVATAGDPLPTGLRLMDVVSGLTQPLGVRHAGDARLFVIQQNGQIRIVSNGVLQATPFLNINAASGGTAPALGFSSGGERGLLGLAFDPDYASNGRFFIYFTDGAGDTVVARYQRSAADANLADPSSGQVVLRIDQDFSNHNGGDLHFGLDGMLYIGLGDGGSGNDPCNRAQTLNPADLVGASSGGNGSDCPADPAFLNSGGDPDSRALLGKMLRIDVSTGGTGNERCGAGGSQTGYGIPADNPYATADGVCDEVYASGLRNPYRFSVDRQTGDLWIGDVGQGAREEVDLLPVGSGGLNFGWRCREGFIATPGITCTAPPAFTDPVYDYPRTVGRSITGGFRYRGPETSWQGAYVFADFVDGRYFVADPASTGLGYAEWRQGGNPSGFGEDSSGRLYAADYGGCLREVTREVLLRAGFEARACP
ncbi:PQQ-dependent sugar dehydrogenase [Pseudomarimonas salicorniae]|uniref:PQQ-dependent sugar dehydrogenase n=1 Tax=Pseudomarimonas salicorniae TaxID=2933270 RepID=A0ABT0GDB7_9GAMM|nr:PQQ-dependent sugar dehydrogenase [Lysobacter sp. CAU 1642]MCK7592523.1 PQQ-dependent sugar dehydrogenase [Lysobacter sp. CAU 1642]